MPYKKGGLAEQLGKLRRTAKRRIARLQKEIERSSSDRERSLFMTQIEGLREEIGRTYIRNPYTKQATGYTEDQRKIAKQNLMRANQFTRIGQGSQKRRNFLIQQELNLAEKRDFIGPTQSRYTKEEVNIFYAATQEAWQGLSPAQDRNRAIIEYYKEKGAISSDSLEEIVDLVLSINSKALSRVEDGEVSDESGLQQSDQDNSPSPAYLAYVVTVTDYMNAQTYITRP